MFVLSSAQMRELDRRTIAAGVPESVLIERAAAAVVAAIESQFPAALSGCIGFLCGPGNNGADGRAAARMLQSRRVAVNVVNLGDDAEWEAQRSRLFECSLVVDALFGTGLGRPLEGVARRMVEDLNRHYKGAVLAVDLPSGIEGGEEDPAAMVVRASATVSFAAPKLGHFLGPHVEAVGVLTIADIGMDAEDGVADALPLVRLTRAADCAPILASRPRASHKGTFGHVLVVGGSRGKSGAAALAATAALRIGAGLVTAAVPASVLAMVSAARAELMTLELPEASDGTACMAGLDLDGLLRSATVVALGPGLSQSASSGDVARALVAAARQPLVVDADGLNAFSGKANALRRSAPLVLTPHPGEMGRLCGVTTAAVQMRRRYFAERLAAETGAVVVLKGHRSLVADPGGDVWINSTGNPGMATAGAGDVLTGLIAGLLAQFPHLPLVTTVAAAVYLHGRAGEVAAARLGEMCMLAGDLIGALPRALHQLRQEVDAAEYPLILSA